MAVCKKESITQDVQFGDIGWINWRDTVSTQYEFTQVWLSDLQPCSNMVHPWKFPIQSLSLPWLTRITCWEIQWFFFPSLRYTHWFDGMAMMHRFHIRDGDVTYSSRFLRSDSYVRNSEKNRIVVSEFGTVAMPDPCKNIFARFFSRFQIPSMCVFFTYCLFPCVIRLSTPAVQNAPFKVFSSFVPW